MDVINVVLLIGAVLSMALRLFTVAAYGRGDSAWLTIYLPTLAVMVLLTRVLVVRLTDLLESGDFSFTICVALVLVTQLTAGLVAWITPTRKAPISIPVHDAQVMAKLDELGEQITALPEPTTAGITVSDADVPVHDAKLMARIDVMSDRVTVTGDAVDALTEDHKQ